jgi:hypothetical protein
MLLHIMVEHNPNKRTTNKLLLFHLYYGGLGYIYMKYIHVIMY